MAATDDLRQRRRESFGRRLRALRLAAGMTQGQLADKAGLDRAFYVDLENAKHGVQVDRIYDMADTMGVSPADLFTE